MTDTPSQPPPRTRWFGVLLLILCAALWSLNGPLIKVLRETGLSGIEIACYRSIFGGALFLIPALRRRQSLKRCSWRWPLFSVIAFTVMTGFFVVSTAETAAANAIILQYTSPAWVFLMSPLILGERVRWSDGLVLLMAMSGVAVIFFGHGAGDTPALMMGLASGLGYGCLTVAIRGLRQVHPLVVVAINFLGSGLLLLPLAGFTAPLGFTSYQLMLVVLMSVVQFAIPYAIFSWALQYVEAHRASLIVLLEAILNPLLTRLIVGEAVPGPTLIGGPLILASVVSWMLLSWRHESRLHEPPPG